MAGGIFRQHSIERVAVNVYRHAMARGSRPPRPVPRRRLQGRDGAFGKVIGWYYSLARRNGHEVGLRVGKDRRDGASKRLAIGERFAQHLGDLDRKSVV